VLARLRSLFWSLAAEQAKVASLETLQRQTQQLVRVVQKRVERGESRPVEATRMEIEHERVGIELGSARTLLSARQAELAMWLGGLSGRTPRVVADLEQLPRPVDRDAALALARAASPALAVSLAKTQELLAELSVERRARVPELSVRGFATNELDRRALGAGIAMDLPLWNWNAGRIAQATSRLSAGRNEAEAVRLEIEAEVVRAWTSCTAAVQAAARHKERLLPRAERAAETLERTWQLGEAGILDVLDARRTLLEAHRQYLNVLVETRVECGRLHNLTGGDAS
jgi:cobalt-zinc-cadmium efflux system outer membrane protein